MPRLDAYPGINFLKRSNLSKKKPFAVRKNGPMISSMKRERVKIVNFMILLVSVQVLIGEKTKIRRG